jgi:hypothetical protein
MLKEVGLVSAAVWSDLDQDGFPELILACEWGPIRVFHNAAGTLTEVTAALGLSEHTGSWNGITTGDFDGDGRLDIVASNWGLNSEYSPAPEQPLRLYYGDFGQRGDIDLIQAQWDPQRKDFFPLQRLDLVAASAPAILQSFKSFRAFSEANMTQVAAMLPKPLRYVEARNFGSMLFLNRRDHFAATRLPPRAQWSPAFGIAVADFNNDGLEDLFLAQNFFAVRPGLQLQDAGCGLVLLGTGSGQFRTLSPTESGVVLEGEQRGAAVCDFDEDGRTDLVVGQSGGATILLHNLSPKLGLRVRLHGTTGNPLGIGASLRLKYGEKWGPTREIHSGSGYSSQDSAVQVLGMAEAPSAIEVRWPGGEQTRVDLPPGAKQVEVEKNPKRAALK